jgi:hypothetical protein
VLAGIHQAIEQRDELIERIVEHRYTKTQQWADSFAELEAVIERHEETFTK